MPRPTGRHLRACASFCVNAALGRACVFHAGDTNARRIQTDGEINAGAPDSPAYAAREYAASAGRCRALEGAAPGRWSCPGTHGARSTQPFAGPRAAGR